MGRMSNMIAREIIRESKRVKKEKMHQLSTHSIHIDFSSLKNLETVWDIAKRKTDQLLNDYKKYENIISKVCKEKYAFNFKQFEKSYVKKAFIFNDPPEREIPVLEPVPKETKLETIFIWKKQKRLAIIDENHKIIEEINAKYKVALEKYEIEKIEAKKKWKLEEIENQEEICVQNMKISEWEENYYNGEHNALNRYFHVIYEIENFFYNTMMGIEFSYNIYNKRLVINLYIKGRDEIFELEGYKIVYDFIEKPVRMKVTEAKKRYHDLLLQIIVASNILIFNTDIGELFDERVINVFNKECCLISSDIIKNNFCKYNFENESDVNSFIELQVRDYKQESRGVKPFEKIYQELE